MAHVSDISHTIRYSSIIFEQGRQHQEIGNGGNDTNEAYSIDEPAAGEEEDIKSNI